MVNFDVSSLCTNIQDIEAITVCVNRMFRIDNDVLLRLVTTEFDRMLSLFVSNLFFQFNNELHEQREGLSTASPIAPASAILLMSHLEESFITQCQTQFKPLLY